MGLFLQNLSTDDIENYYLYSHNSKSWEEVFSIFLNSFTIDKNEPERMKSVPTAYPPCIKEYLSQGTDGVPLPSWALVTLSNFLLMIGHNDEKIKEIMKDFKGVDRRMYWYLRQFSMSRRAIPVPACALLEKQHLCYKGLDPICLRIKDYGTPITYYKRKLEAFP